MESAASVSKDSPSPGDCTTPIRTGPTFDSDSKEDEHARVEFHRCTACKHPYSDPRVLNCLHTFCACCLEGMVVTKDEKKCVQCQKCSVLTQCPTGSLLKDIQVNFGLRRHIETLTFDRSDHVLCRSCRQDYIAIARCFDCSLFMCEQCTTTHRRLTVYSDHTIGDMSTPFNRLTDQQPCGKHPHLLATVYCQDCSEPFCKLCSLRHESCKKTAITDSSYAELITNVTIEQTQSLKQAEYYSKGMTQLESSSARAMEDLAKAKEEYERRVNEHFTVLQQQIKQLAKDTRAAASAQYQAHNTYCSELEKANMFMQIQSNLALAWDNMQTMPFIENTLQMITSLKPDSLQINFSLEFVGANPNAIPTLGYVSPYQTQVQPDQLSMANQQQSIARPTSVNRSSSQSTAQSNSYNKHGLSNGYRQSGGNPVQAQRTNGFGRSNGFTRANGSNSYDMVSVHSNDFNHFPAQTANYQMQTSNYQAMQTTGYQAQPSSYQAHVSSYQQSTTSPVAMPSYSAPTSSNPRYTPSPVTTPSYLTQTPSYQAQQTPNYQANYQRSGPSPMTPNSQGQTLSTQAQTSNYQRSTSNQMTSSQPNSARLSDEAVFNCNNLSLNQATGAKAKHTLQSANFSSASNQIQPYQPRSNGVDQQSDSSTTAGVVSVSNAPTASLANHSRSYSPLERRKMACMTRFGGYGNNARQFTEPGGVTVDGSNRILVADTNNHRVQIFDVFGKFYMLFGRDGFSKLTFPNCIAVSKKTGMVVITERAPSNRVKIYTLQGCFLYTFGKDEIEHPRGVAIDNDDNIIIVECQVKMVVILSMEGQVKSKFSCSDHVIFPNSVAVNDKKEIFISDNRGHNVQVFNYEGTLLRTIGGEGLTKYPIAVAINQRGEVVVADNHYSFKLTVFTQQGELVAGYISETKHAQCLDVALTNDGVAILTSSDFNVYCYPYQNDCPYLQNH